MAHFAQLDQNNVVTGVYVINDYDIVDDNGKESEDVGIQFCKSFFGENTNWKQTSYNNRIRFRYAGIGMIYNEEYDVFLFPQPYPSWILNTENYEWEPPIPEPKLTDEQMESKNRYIWNEEILNWELKILD